MLKWITGEKLDHPLADIEQTREIIADLPTLDSSRALEDVIYWLDSLNRTEGFKLAHRFETVDLLDAAAKIHQRKLSQDYLSTGRQQKFRENKLWTNVYGLWKHLGDAYLKCVAQYESGTTTSSTARKMLPVITARGLRALTLQLKWTLLRYGLAEPRIWSELSRLYQLAEASGFVNDTLAVYPGAHGESSVRREFLNAMMISASSTDGLTPVQQEIAERVVANYSGLFKLGNAPAAGCNYYFDLAAGQPPARMMKSTAPAATLRYFGAGEALLRLKELAAAIRETGGIPHDVHLGGAFRNELILGVLAHLMQYWAENPPARSAERRKMATRITIVPGLTDILGTLDPVNNDELDFSEERTAESWIVENVSAGGYGAIIPAAKSDWVKVGSLIGMQSETSIYWGIGLVRRVASDTYQQRRVGIQQLSKTAIPVRISHAASGIADNGLRADEPAVLLSTTPDSNGEVGIILRAGLYNSRNSMDMTANGKPYLLMPAGMVEGGEDFDWARFKVMRRSV